MKAGLNVRMQTGQKKIEGRLLERWIQSQRMSEESEDLNKNQRKMIDQTTAMIDRSNSTKIKKNLTNIIRKQSLR